MKTKSLVTSSLIFTIGTMLIQGLNFITLPIYTRIDDLRRTAHYGNGLVRVFCVMQALRTGGLTSKDQDGNQGRKFQ